MIAALDAATSGNQIVQALKFFSAQAEGQAQFAQITIRAGCLDDGQRDFLI
jgi:hypothetical protein